MSIDEIKLEFYMALKNTKTIELVNDTIYRQLAKEMAEVHEKLVKNCSIPGVVGQGEQLKCRCIKDPLGSGTVLRCCDECAKSGKF